MQELAHYRESVAFDERERLALDLSSAMCQTPAEVPDELRDALARHFSRAQIVELTAAVAWENYRARFNRANGVRPAGFSEGAYCVLPARPDPVSR